MRKITADLIYPIATPPVKNGVVIVDDNGIIMDVLPMANANDESVERFNGVICPGFVNTHCHLELSHMRGTISEKTGMTGFISELMQNRSKIDPAAIAPAMEAAEQEMIRNGIVAVGDISNDASTFALKAKQNLKYHTFIELFDIFPQRAREVFEKGIGLHKKAPQSASLAPHAPYTVSPPLMHYIGKHAQATRALLSIHNQESESEAEMFVSKTGKMVEMFNRIGNDLSYFDPTGINSLRSMLPLFPKENKTLLVHNTFTSREDIEWAGSVNENIYWCFCPNANLYIEDALPDFNAFADAGLKCTIGTDSLASNWSLSVLDELKVISKAAPNIPLETLLTWATKNGAEFLDFNELGTIEKGKKPGLVLIEGVEGMKLGERLEARRLL